jgi:small subunit ribosomal protein S9
MRKRDFAGESPDFLGRIEGSWVSGEFKMAELVQYYGTGRRKSSVARVFLRPGSGDFKVNGKAFDVHFVTEAQRIMAKSPLAITETSGSFDVVCTVDGGGVNGQAGAVRMGIARALQEFNPELRAKLKAEGFLRRDARVKERKKYGQKGARKRFQFSKR